MKYISDLRNGIVDLIENKNTFFIGEDIQEPYGGAFKVTKGLSDKYPENIIGMPMCEQGFTGMGVGMAMYGCHVAVEMMFGDFVTLAADQVINHAAKFRELYNSELHFVLRCPSGAYRGYGATHSQSLEKMYMGVPGIQVVAASIAYSPGKLLDSAISSGIPTLFVENKLDYPRDLLEDKGSCWKKTIIDNCGFPLVSISPIEDEPDVVIVTYGGLVDMAIQAMQYLLYEDEINVEVVVPSLISDIQSLISYLPNKPHVILEEGVCEFGWGSEVACVLTDKYKNHVVRLGAKDSFIPAAKQAELSVLPSFDIIVEAVRKEMEL